MSRPPRVRARRAAAAVAGPFLVLTLLVQPAVATSTDGHGAEGIGDPYFPLEGNGGYEARHDTLHVR